MVFGFYGSCTCVFMADVIWEKDTEVWGGRVWGEGGSEMKSADGGVVVGVPSDAADMPDRTA